MASDSPTSVRELLLTRCGLVFVDSTGVDGSEDKLVAALELEWAKLGFVGSSRLHERLLHAGFDELAVIHESSIRTLGEHLGVRKHACLFRQFPAGVPADTVALWWQKVLVHFAQVEGQPCLTCKQVGTTHVLDPCRHVVCDRCFDGSNYSACPVCERHVDIASPFFREPAPREPGVETVVLKVLELGDDVDRQAEQLFVSLCARTQALSPDDRGALTTLVTEYRERVLAWVPSPIPVRENRALIFGTLMALCNPVELLAIASTHITTATDVLRLIAVFSGTDGALQRETIYKPVERKPDPAKVRFWGAIAKLFGADQPSHHGMIQVPLRVDRFKVAKLSRPLRRMLLGLLERVELQQLTEDMLRHRSYWVWVGEFLHPHEHAARFPNVASAFAVVRTKAPDGTPAPEFRTWHARVERAIAARDARAMVDVLAERPGEFARRLDLALRTASDADALAHVIATFRARLSDYATPVLVTLRSHLPTRTRPATVRLYWPKGSVGIGASTPDERASLTPSAIDPIVEAIDGELLRRFGSKPSFAVGMIDEGLASVIVPFNERTASRSAVALPRGSRVAIPTGKTMRLYLHWCQPERGGEETDLDLSVGFYDEHWKYIGVCSYYQLQALGQRGAVIAQSAGDLRDAPWPDGASEFVDLHRDVALANGVRWAVAVVNAYAGMSFDRLERAEAGLMLRDDVQGEVFDPRTVALRFDLAGDNGVFMPCALDVREGVLHWLDVHAKGHLEFNNVATSNWAITKVVPEMIEYFGSGVRTSMFDLGLLHLAARCRTVLVRGAGGTARYVRGPTETALDFHWRIVERRADVRDAMSAGADDPPTLAMLLNGDLSLPERSEIYALFREKLAPTLSAADLLA